MKYIFARISISCGIPEDHERRFLLVYHVNKPRVGDEFPGRGDWVFPNLKVMFAVEEFCRVIVG